MYQRHFILFVVPQMLPYNTSLHCAMFGQVTQVFLMSIIHCFDVSSTHYVDVNIRC